MDLRFSSVYVEKNGLFNSRKLNIALTFHEDNISVSALKISSLSGYFYQSGININYSDIKDYFVYQMGNSKALKIDICKDASNHDWTDSFIFPFEPKFKIEDIIVSIEEHIEVYKQVQAQKLEKEQEFMRVRQEQEQQQQQYLMELKKYYNTVYNFHVKDNTPVYTFNQQDTNCFIAYVSENRNLNFLLIEAKTQTEIHTIITYDEIHYYEKAGEVHYATNINANYKGEQSFGGSFVGAKISTGAVALGGLLLGQMGMAIGALSSYKPATYTPPKHIPSQLNISSEITKIDERSVILNYYSEQHKQYIDIELPQEMFNFLQTYLPEKKYAIVIEKEKQTAILGSNVKQAVSTEDTIIQRLQKLKQLYEMELISESEYAERKKEILAEL